MWVKSSLGLGRNLKVKNGFLENKGLVTGNDDGRRVESKEGKFDGS